VEPRFDLRGIDAPARCHRDVFHIAAHARVPSSLPPRDPVPCER
jgi:hypothetical protein